MPVIVLITIACLAGGAVFVALATYLMTRKGNTIKDVLMAENLKDAEAIKIDILNKIKITSNIPIVGLFLVGALVAIGFPSYFLYIHAPSSSSGPYLVGQIGNPDLVDWSKGERIYAFFPDMSIRGDGWFQIPLRNISGIQSVIFESSKTNPLTLTLRINALQNKVEVITGAFEGKAESVPFDGSYVRLPALKMSKLAEQKATIQNQPSEQPKLSPEFANLPEVTRGR